MTPPELWSDLGFVPGQVIRVFGMRRSGNHAIVDWLARNAPNQRSMFLNNCVPGKLPMRGFRTITVNGRRAPAKTARGSLSALGAEVGDGGLLIFSYEDVMPVAPDREDTVSGRFDPALIGTDLVLCRSFLNWSASLLKKMQGNDGFSPVRRGASVLRAIEIYHRMLGLVSDASDARRRCICYDDWVASEDYRAGVLQDLGLPVTDNTLGKVQKYGGGSSFQGKKVSAAHLATDERAALMADDAEYKLILGIAAQDQRLVDDLAGLFPQDAEQLKSFTAGTGP